MTTTITTFAPGECLKPLGIRRDFAPRLGKLRVRFPSRIHLTPIDCNRFEFGKPGGGGIGFAVDLPNSLCLTLSGGETPGTQNNNGLVLALHYVRLMEEIGQTRLPCSISMSLSETVTQHCGLGSSVSVATAMMWALNEMCGGPLTCTELRNLIAHNFVEEYGTGLARGLETGVGTSVILRGGISVVADNVVEVYHRRFPSGYDIVLAIPQTTRPDADKPESEDMLRRTFFLESSYRYIKAYNILMDIIPALEKDDMSSLGAFLWDIQFSGTHLSMIQSYECYGKAIYDVLGELRGAGSLVCGLSSVGPAVFAVTRTGETPEILARLRTRLGDAVSLFTTSPNNTGVCRDESEA